MNFSPNLPAGSPVPEVQLLTNLNRRDFAVLEQDLSALTPADNTAYTRAYSMTPTGTGGFTITLPVNKCGAYRLSARYRVNGGAWMYFTDNGQRRDCAVVVSPRKALDARMYEINPSTVEATAPTFAGRSTFRDLYTANTDRPDVINPAHFSSIGVNTLWLPPVHPIGFEAKGVDPATTQPYDPGSPYAVRDYWKVNQVLGANNTEGGAMTEFVDFVQQMDNSGVSVMMDGTFNHSAPDVLVGQGGADLFGFDPNAKIRDVRPQRFSKTDHYDQPADVANQIATAPDRSDFGKWTDVRDFYFGDYDALVKTPNNADKENYLLERDEFSGHTAYTRELWQYFAYYPTFWLTKTGCPPGTPPEQSYKGIDGLRCDFAQGLPSQFWEYCINKTRSVKWDFLFMAESLDGFRSVGANMRHGVSYRSARHFDILNENIVFYLRDQFFAYPANGQNSAGAANPTTYPTYQAYDDRRNAYDNIVLLNNLTSHDEVFPSNDPYSLLYAYSALAVLDGIPLMMYGQEAGAKNDFSAYSFSGVANSNNNWDSYELNFGKSIPNFKRFNSMRKVWQNRDWNLQTLYGRINHARGNSPALRNQNVYFLGRTDTGTFDPNIFAVAKYQEPGVSAAWQDVVFAFLNTNYSASSNRWATFNVNTLASNGANRFGIVPAQTYNVVDLLAANPTARLWSPARVGSEIISAGITVGLTATGTSGGQAQYLKLIDTTGAHTTEPNNYVSTDFDGDGVPNDWETANGLDPQRNDGAEDEDGDGLTNYEEFLAGTKANDSASKLEVKTLTANGSAIDLSWKSVAGENYRIRHSSDLASWQELADSNNLPITVTADGSETTFHMIMPAAASAGRMFFRVELKR